MIVEIRVPLPFTVEEFETGMFYTLTREYEESFTSGVKCLIHDTYETSEKGVFGIYTKREFNYGSLLPKLITSIVTSLKDMWFTEDCYYDFPRIRSETYCDSMKDKFQFKSESAFIANDNGSIENIFNLSKEKLSQRKVYKIDLLNTTNSLIPNPSKLASEIPSGFEYIKENEWFKKITPASCSYTLLNISYSGFLQQKVENMLVKDMIERLQLSRLKSVLWSQQWKSLSLQQVLENDREFEERIHKKQGYEYPNRRPVTEIIKVLCRRHTIMNSENLNYSSSPSSPSSSSSSLLLPSSNNNKEIIERDQISSSTTSATTVVSLLSDSHPLMKKRRQIRKKVRAWYKQFVLENKREPTNLEFSINLVELFKLHRDIERLIEEEMKKNENNQLSTNNNSSSSFVAVTVQ